VFRHLVATKSRAKRNAKGLDVGIADDCCRHDVSEAFVRDAEDGSVRYAIEGEECRLDFGRGNARTAPIDHLAETAADEETPVSSE
jgi:hypothetical protein